MRFVERQVGRVGQAPGGGHEGRVKPCRNLVAVLRLHAGVGGFLAQLVDVGAGEGVRVVVDGLLVGGLGRRVRLEVLLVGLDDLVLSGGIGHG